MTAESAMTEPTQQEIERAKATAHEQVSWCQSRHKDCRKAECNEARVLLALLAEREALKADAEFAWQSNDATSDVVLNYHAALKVARASGRRAGLLELAEWLETSRGGLDPLPEPRAYYEGQRDVLGNVASRARAMAEKEG